MATVLDTSDEKQLVFPDYETTLYTAFESMFHKKQLTDATLMCENQSIGVHKFMLSSSSSFFNEIFKTAGASVSIDFVSYKNLMMVLQLIYTGQIILHPHEVNSFTEATKKLSIQIGSQETTSVQTTKKNWYNKPQIAESNLSKSRIFEQKIHSDRDIVVITKNNSGKSASSNQTRTVSVKNDVKDETKKSKMKPNDVKDQTNQKTGILEINHQEFFHRMFQANNLPWPTNSTQAIQLFNREPNITNDSTSSNTNIELNKIQTPKPKMPVRTNSVNKTIPTASVNKTPAVKNKKTKPLSSKQIRNKIRSLASGIKKDVENGFNANNIEQKQKELNKLIEIQSAYYKITS